MLASSADRCALGVRHPPAHAGDHGGPERLRERGVRIHVRMLSPPAVQQKRHCVVSHQSMFRAYVSIVFHYL